MIKLKSTSLVCVDCQNHGGAIAALKKSLQEVSVDKVILFTDRHFNIPGIEVIVIPKITSKDLYSHFLIKEIHKYIETDYILTVQHDGWIISGDAWMDEFYEYDFIGAPWLYIDSRNVGNGAVSWRSRKLINALGTDNFIEIVPPEDEIIGRLYRKYLETKYGIKYAPEELAHRFSYELHEPTQKTLGFHGSFWPPFQETVVIKRMASLGDVIQTEAVMHYFHKKGYRVVLETLPQFYELFRSHYFPVIPFGQLNPKIPYTLINLDMSYESDPKKLHLKAYYEFAGVPEKEQLIVNPKLNFLVDEQTKLFKKYVVIHIDKRPDGHRDARGVDWKQVVDLIKEKGYTPIQIGKNNHEETRATYMATVTENLMAYLICGCDLFLGIDSGPANVALATGRKMITFHGSVNPEYIYPDMKNVCVITNHGKEKPCCPLRYCWHESIGCEGQKCIVDSSNPPCSIYDTNDVLNAINEML